MPRVYVKTHGCQMNEYDSARMADVLRAAGGYEPTDRPDPSAGAPDTGARDREGRQVIGIPARSSKGAPSIAGGCHP